MWKTKVLNNAVVQSVAILVFANILSQIIQTASLPIVSRLFSPDNFGVLAVFWSSVGVLSVVSSLRYELSIPLPVLQRNASLLLSLSLYLNFFFSCFILVVALLFGSQITNILNIQAIEGYLWILPIAVFFIGTYKALNYMVLRIKNYKKSGIVKVKQSIAQVLFTVTAGWFSAGELGLILGLVFGSFVAVVSLVSISEFKKLCVDIFVFSSRLRMLVLVKRFRKFPIFDVPAAGLNVLSAHLPNFVIASLFGASTAGLYYLAERVFAIPMSLLGKAVSQVFYSQSVDDILKGVYRRKVIVILLALFCVAIPPVLILFFYAEPLFVFVFGDEWREAGLYVSWLVFGLAVQFVYSPLSMVLMATEGQRVNLMLHSGMFLAKAAVLYLGYSLNDIEYAVKGLSAVLAAGYGLGIIIVLVRSGRADKLSGSRLE